MAENDAQEIVKYLKTCNDSKSELSKIKSELHLEKKVVNRQLYLLQSKNIVKKLQDSPPIWQLTEKRAGVRSPQKKLQKKTSPNKTSPKLQSTSQATNILPRSRTMSYNDPFYQDPNYRMARGGPRGRGWRGPDRWRGRWRGRGRGNAWRGKHRDNLNLGQHPTTRPLQAAHGSQSGQKNLTEEVLGILHADNKPLTEKMIFDRIGHYTNAKEVNLILEKLINNNQVVKISSHDSNMHTYMLKLSVNKVGVSNTTEMEYEEDVNDKRKAETQSESEQLGQTSVLQAMDNEVNEVPGSSVNPSQGSSQQDSIAEEGKLQNPANDIVFSSLGFEPSHNQDEDILDEDFMDEDRDEDEKGFKWNEQNTFTIKGYVPEIMSDEILKTLSKCPVGMATLFILAKKLGMDVTEIEKILKSLSRKKLVEEVDSSISLWGISEEGESYLSKNKLITPNDFDNPNFHGKADTSRIDQVKSCYMSSEGLPKPPKELLQTNTVFNLQAASQSGVPDEKIGRERLSKMASDLNPARSTVRSEACSGRIGIGRGQQLRNMVAQASPSQKPGALFSGTSENVGFAEMVIPPGSPNTLPSTTVIRANLPSASMKPYPSSTVAKNPENLSFQCQWAGTSVKQEVSAPMQTPSSFKTSPGIPLTPKELLSKESNSQNKSAANSTGLSSSNQTVSHLPSSSYQKSQGSYFAASSSSSSPVAAGAEAPVPILSGFTSNLNINSECFSAVNKNPVSALMEYAQSRHMTAKIEIVSQRGPPHKPTFIIAAIIGDRVFPGVKSNNKKDGRAEAADLALRTLLSEGQYKINQQTSVSSTPNANMTHFDKMAALSHQAFNQLIATIPEKFAGRKVIAALIMKTSHEDTGTVISVGSGNRCITGEQLSLEGNTVNDSHAEIITRRGFLRFLYKQLETYSSDKPHDLFENGGAGKLRIKSTITFHLYISTAPCGDGALFSPRDAASNRGAVDDVENHDHQPTFTSNVQGLLRTKMEGGEGTIPVEPDFTVQTWDGIIRGERLRTMSCTDKICRWNIVGLQGALLSHLIHPVYLNSLTLGYLYDHGHLARAVCCRAGRGEPDISTQLPSNYHLNHPWLGRMTACEPQRETQKTKALSINWCHGDERPEVIDGTQGRCYTGVERHFFSRICKKELFQSFKLVCSKFGRNDLVNIPTYLESKKKATDFQEAKGIMLKRLKDNGFGTWVSKPVEEEMFTSEAT